MKIAVLGLGTMGAPMAENLIKAGFEVTVQNRTRSKEEALEALGAARAATPAAAAANVEIILTCVSDTPDVERVLLDPETGAINGLKEGGLVIDCSSIAPEATRRVAEEFRAKGIGFVDAPLSGGSEGAIRGTLTVMCGGSEEDFERARPVLRVIGSKITRIGPVGCGQNRQGGKPGGHRRDLHGAGRGADAGVPSGRRPGKSRRGDRGRGGRFMDSEQPL